MALVSFRLFCKNLGNLQEFFGQMDYRPPWQKIARTPMGLGIHSDKVLFCLRCRMVPPPTRGASLHRKPLTNENFKQKRLLAASTHVNPAEEDFFCMLGQ